MTTVSETAGDLWIHRERDELWWTVSLDAPPTFEDKDEPIERGARVTVCHKPCELWGSVSV